MEKTDLRTALDEAANRFIDTVFTAVRSSTVEELQSSLNGSAPKKFRTIYEPPHSPAPKRSTGRLARRSEAEIQKAVDRMLGLLKGKPKGMRSEHIKLALGMDVREMPRVLKALVASKKVRTQGQKRATTYMLKS